MNGRKILPWPIAQLNSVLASARTMPRMVAEVPARLWWPALVLTILDTGEGQVPLLDVPREGYDHLTGTLSVGGLVYRLHPLAVEALDAIRRHDGGRLFAWPLENGSTIKHMLGRSYRTLLYRADLPHVATNLFRRLQVTADFVPNLLNRVNGLLPFTPRQGKPSLARARDRRRWGKTRRKPGGRRRQHIFTLKTNSERSLLKFFEDVYRPRRLVGCSPVSIAGHRDIIRRLGNFTGHEMTLDELSDDLINDWMTWQVERGLSPETANGCMGHILALWRYAWKKRLVEELPRDVEKIRTPRRIPEAWSQRELAQILESCAEAGGAIAGIPAAIWWISFVLASYDSGLRLATMLSLRTEDLDPERGIVYVRAEHQKQKADQVIRLHKETLAALKEGRCEDRELLFPIPWKGTQPLTRRYKAILKRAGLPYGHRDLFHKLRRTHGTYVFDVAGEDATIESLGHGSRQTAKASYIDFRKVTRHQFAADLLPRPDWKRPSPDTIPFDERNKRCAS